MNLIIRLLSILPFILIFTFQLSCTKEKNLDIESIENNQIIELKFLNGTIKEEVQFRNNEWVPKSKNLIRLQFLDSKTGKSSYGYSYIKLNKTSNLKAKEDTGGKVERGLYGWNGTCFIWGTLYTDDNGESLFVAADYLTQQYLNVCPNEGEAFAKESKINNSKNIINEK